MDSKRAKTIAIGVALAALLLLAALLRLWRINAISFTYDAAALSNLAAQWVDTGTFPLQGMVSSIGVRNPALGVYVISLPVLVSRDPAVLAGFVVLLNVTGVFGTYWLGRRYWGAGVGLLAALLFAVSPWAIQHSRGILGQDLLIPGGVLFFVFVFAWVVDDKLWALSAAIVTAMALLQIHLAALAFLPILAVLLVWQLAGCLKRREPVHFWRPLVIGVGLGGLLYVPYLVAESQNGWENFRLLLAAAERPYRLYTQTLDFALMAIGGRNIHSLAGAATFRSFMNGLVDSNYRLDRLEELLVVVATAYLAVRWVQHRQDRRPARRDGLLLLWLLGPLPFFLVSRSEVHPHYLAVLYPAPYLALAAALQDVFTRLASRRLVRAGFAVLATVSMAAIVVWQAYLVTSIYRFIDLTETPGGWGAPVRILKEVVHTARQMAALNPESEIVLLCPGSDPRWDECPAVFTFLTSRGPQIDISDYDDPAFRGRQDDAETLVVLAPGDSLAAAELPHLGQALPDADVSLRDPQQGAYRFYRIHNPYRDIASYLEAMGLPGDAIVLVGPGQREDLARFYAGDLPILELPDQPQSPEATERDLEQLTQDHSRLFVLYRASEAIDPQGAVDRWLRANTFSGAEQWLGRVRMVIAETKQPAETWPVIEPMADFGGQILLHRLVQSAETVEAGGMLNLELDWQALATPAADYSIFIQLLDQDGRVQAQRDLPLVDAGRPSSTWQAGQEATTRVGVTFPPGTPPGAHRLVLGLYNPADGNRLATGQTDYLDLGSVAVDRPHTPAGTALSGLRFRPAISFSEVTLMGFDRFKSGFAYAPATPVLPGDTLTLAFEWRADVRPTQDWQVLARLVDETGRIVASLDGPLAGGRYAASQWTAGETVRGDHSLALPSTLTPGRYALQVAVVLPGVKSGDRWTDLGPVVVR